jgi:hypothetical protein
LGEDAPTDIQGYLDKIKSEFGLQVHYKNKRSEWNHLLSYKLVRSDAEALTGLKLIYNGLSRYPSGFIGKLKLNYIALGGEISTKDGVAATGVALGNPQQTMLLIQATTKESVMHHELFHAFEYAFGLRFADWDKANVKSDLYDEDLKKNYDLLPPGFITRYSLSMPEEDRAELFMYMMTDSLKDQLVDTAGHDGYLKDKIRRLNNTLETNLGKIAQGSRWSATAAAATAASPKTLKTVAAAPGAKFYEGPDSGEFSAVADAPQGAAFGVVQTGARWLKVFHEGGAYYMLAAETQGAPAPNSPPSAPGEEEPAQEPPQEPQPTAASNESAENIYGVAERLLQNHGIRVSVNDALTLYDDLAAGAVRDYRGAASLALEYEALLSGGFAAPSGVKDLVICRTLSQGGGVRGAAMDGSGTVLFISQQAAGNLKTVMEELVSQL